jgi:polysaccharide export outer membrane protein
MSKTYVVIFLLIFGATGGRAQTGSAASTEPAGKKKAAEAVMTYNPQPAAIDARYRIGPGDVLDVRVARAPELSRDSVRVDQSGMIRMPMLDDDIPAACLTEGQLAQSIAKLYRKYKNDPHVDVFVKEFQSQPVAVIGAVRSPAQFKLQRPVRLSELLSFVGGPSDSAGQTVQVIHAGGADLCEKSANTEDDSLAFVSYKLSDTLHAVKEANPFVRPGDLIQVPNADQVFVLGNVLRPSIIPMKEPLTISRAIAIAGGPGPSTRKDKVRILRQVAGSTRKQEIFVDLTAIEKNKSEDLALLPNDVIDVPISGTRSILRSLVGAVVPTVTQLPMRAIP